MSSASIQSIIFAYHETTIYIGFFVLIGGLLGNTLNIIIFTSLKTFRETSCGFYLTVASIVNIFQLIASLFSRILIAGYAIDLTQTSSVLCKLRQFVSIVATLVAITCMCFATIDQFLSLTIRWRHLTQLRIARRMVAFILLFWCLYGIPFIIFYNNVFSTSTGTWSCAITNQDLNSYFTRFHIPYLLGFIQLIIRIIFGLLAFINARSLANRQVAIVRMERDKQLTSMVLIEVFIDVVLSLPFFIYYMYTTYITTSDPVELARYQLIISVTNVIFYSTFAVGFYIYCCSSSRFRKQLIYVLIKVHLKYWCGINPQGNNNQVGPQQLEEKRVAASVVINA